MTLLPEIRYLLYAQALAADTINTLCASKRVYDEATICVYKSGFLRLDIQSMITPRFRHYSSPQPVNGQTALISAVGSYHFPDMALVQNIRIDVFCTTLREKKHW